MTGAVAARLGDGRLHLQHGPIDLVITARGGDIDVAAAEAAAWRRFQPLLEELVAELPALRGAAAAPETYRGAITRRMARAVQPFAAETFVTPMAAVAGSVADEVLGAMLRAADLEMAIVNNGGDIALHLADGQSASAAIADVAGRGLGRVDIDSATPVRGLATSGRHGRSLSLGIADSVTVLAANAAAADAAATLIANAVDLPEHHAVTRAPASEIDPDSDLGERLVVIEVDVDALGPEDVAGALASGARTAESMLRNGLIYGASLHLMREARVVGAAKAIASRSEAA